jgi:two-component system sensor histidine kinase RegB
MHHSASSNLNNSLTFIIARLTALRLIIAALLLIFVIYLQLNHFNPELALWLILAGYLPLLLTGLLQSKKGLGPNHLVLHLIVEIQLITFFLYFTGGAGNPLISYFLVLIVIAAYNLKKLWVWLIACTCIIDYTLLTQFYLPLELPLSSHHLAGSDHDQGYLILWHLTGMWLTFVISAITLSLLIPSLMEITIKKRQQLTSLREKQLKNEQLIGIATLAAGTAHEMGTPLMTMEILLNDSLEHNERLNTQDHKLLHQQVILCRQSLQRLALAGRNINTIDESINADQWLTSLLNRWRLSQPSALWLNLGFEHNANIRKSSLLDQALLNLLDNATQAGNETIELSSTIVDQQWQLTIRQPDLQASSQIQEDNLFNSQKEHGIGLGLYLSNASIEQFNGQVHLVANNDGSTSCIISLPCKDEA